jgi:hypothetical protein
MDLEQEKIVYYKVTELEKIKECLLIIFNWHSPFIWGYILQLLTALGLIEIAKRNNYWINNAKTIVSGCDKNCIQHNYQIALASIAYTYLQIFLFAIGIYFFVIHSKKIKNGNLSSMVRLSSLCIILIGLFGIKDAYLNLQSPGTQQALLVTYAPEKIRHVDRSLASEIITYSEYLSSLGKDSKPKK